MGAIKWVRGVDYFHLPIYLKKIFKKGTTKNNFFLFLTLFKLIINN